MPRKTAKKVAKKATKLKLTPVQFEKKLNKFLKEIYKNTDIRFTCAYVVFKEKMPKTGRPSSDLVNLNCSASHVSGGEIKAFLETAKAGFEDKMSDDPRAELMRKLKEVLKHELSEL